MNGFLFYSRMKLMRNNNENTTKNEFRDFMRRLG